jgi:hypothetical protein
MRSDDLGLVGEPALSERDVAAPKRRLAQQREEQPDAQHDGRKYDGDAER